MPPKKIKRVHDPKQITLSISGIIGLSSPVSSCEDKNNESTATTAFNDADVTVTKAKTRTFQKHWLKEFSWLTYVEEKNYMYCNLCESNGARNGMCRVSENRNFQRSTLSRHSNLDDHRKFVMAPKLRSDMEKVQKKSCCEQDLAITGLIKVAEWIVAEDMPLSKFKSLVNLLHGFHVADIEILRKSKINYESQVTMHELLDSLAESAEQKVIKKLAVSPYITVLTDESTDLTNKKRQVLYAQILSEDFKPETLYICNTECTDATGVGIAKAVFEEMSTRGVEPRRIMSLGSDGASAMTGNKKGAATIMRRSNPHMHNVHCIAHKLALCSSQSAEKIPMLKKHQQVLTDLFYYFKGSGKREARLHEIQEVLDDLKLTIKEIHSVRWLSFFTALTTVWRTLDSLFTYLAEASCDDYKAKGLQKKIGTDTFIGITHMMMDAMAPVTVLSQFFQTENLDIALVKVKLDECVAALGSVREMQTPYLKKIQEDLTGEQYKGHHVTTTNFDLQGLTHSFIDRLIDNINSRFPMDDLLCCFGVLSLRPISLLSNTQLVEFGNEEIDKLCNYYGQEQVVTWKDDNNETQTMVSKPVINTEETKNEWRAVKSIVLAEKYPRDSMGALWQLIYKYHKNDLPNLIKLAALALTSAVHTAGCERGFSVQNKILVKARNRLNLETQHKLMAVKLSYDETDYDDVLKRWKMKKDRRVYSLS